jgi:hypothetical protein
MQKRSQALISMMVFILLFSFFVPLNAQDTTKPVVEWEKTFGAIMGRTVLAVDDGGFVITGITGNWDDKQGWVNETTVLFKIDTHGNVEWTNNYTSVGTQIIATKDHGYLFFGSTLLKIDSQGKVQWKKTIDQLGYVGEPGITQTSDGGFAILACAQVGWVNVDYSLVNNTYVFIKTDSNGNLLSNKTIEVANTIFFHSIAEGTNGYLLAGTDEDATHEKPNMLLFKTNLTGDIQWKKQYSGYPECSYINMTSDGGYLLEGGGCIVKTDSDGNKLWNLTLTYNGTSLCFAQTKDGGYLLGGQRWFVVDTVGSIGKFSASGVCQWQRQFIAKWGAYTEIRGIAVGSDGSSIFVGTKGENDKETIWVVKFAKDNLPSETYNPIQTATPSSTPDTGLLPIIVVTGLAAFFVGIAFLLKKRNNPLKFLRG